MPTFTQEQLQTFAHGVIEALGSSPEASAIVAEHLATANLAGHDSHGVIRLPQYRRHVQEEKIDPAAEPVIVHQTPTTALLDGNRAWGQVVARRALDLGLEKARECGLAAIAIRDCYHIGRVGVYPQEAARAGMICQVHCNGHGVARVAPWGGTEARMATNPVCIGIPTREEPLVVDITTSVVAEGKVRLSLNAGKDVPEGWILDREGRPTTRPADLYDGGTLLPLGGAQGHKGYGLSVIVDILGGLLGGAGCGFMTEKFGNGVLIQITDPAAFGDAGEFLDRVEAYKEYLLSSPVRPGVESILLPGEPELRATVARRESGIELDEGTLEQLGKLAGELGIPGPGAG